MTNRFADTYFSNSIPMQQQLERITTQPDIVFSATNSIYDLVVSTTGATNWVNNADLNGNISGGGPGTIRPPIKIVFGEPAITNVFVHWGSFDNSTNPPGIYPGP